jgi:hypothetical protein
MVRIRGPHRTPVAAVSLSLPWSGEGGVHGMRFPCASDSLRVRRTKNVPVAGRSARYTSHHLGSIVVGWLSSCLFRQSLPPRTFV